MYIAVACSSATSGFGPLSGGDDASTARGGSDGAAGAGSGGTQDTGTSLVDALTDPVSSAMADPYQSGTRLKAKYYAGSDGSKVYAGMHDSQFGVDCYPEQASDGTTRCIPSGSNASVGVFFADSGCSQPIASITTCVSSKPAYAASTSLSTCSALVYHVFTVGSAFTGQAYAGTPAACEPATVTETNAYAFYSANEVSPAMFVQMTVQTDP